MNIKYRDFSARLKERIGDKPLIGQIELTFKCNLRCAHCYCSSYNRPEFIKKELKLKKIIAILDQISAEGCLWLCFTGGEPLLRDDFFDIYAYAKRKGFIITLFTNGTLLTPEIADFLKKYPPLVVEITLNAVSQKTYEMITRVPGSFKRAKEGIRLIRERNLPLRIKSQAMTINYSELNLIKKFAEDLGAAFKSGNMIYPGLDRSQEPCKLRLPLSELIKMEFPEDNLCERVNHSKIPNLPLRWRDKVFRCAAGIISFNIDPYGNLVFCTFYRNPSFSLKENSFYDGFYSFYSRMRSTKWKTDSKCKDCSLRVLCGTCPGKAYLETGNPEAPVDFLCQLGRMKAEKLGYEITVKESVVA